jgi:uncharacterized Zn finger protein (UPF0148 family)
MNSDLCRVCGQPFDAEDVVCPKCEADTAMVMSMEEPPKVDWNALGDCE